MDNCMETRVKQGVCNLAPQIGTNIGNSSGPYVNYCRDSAGFYGNVQEFVGHMGQSKHALLEKSL